MNVGIDLSIGKPLINCLNNNSIIDLSKIDVRLILIKELKEGE